MIWWERRASPSRRASAAGDCSPTIPHGGRASDGSEPGGGAFPGPASGPLQVPTMAAAALSMIIGVLFVTFAGFTPTYITGFREMDKVFATLQTQATSGITTASSSPILQQRQFASILAAQIAAAHTDGEDTFPATPEMALFYFASPMSRPWGRNRVSVLQFVSVTPGNEWRAMMIGYGHNGSVAGTVQSRTVSHDQVQLFHLDPVTVRSINPAVPFAVINRSLISAIYDPTSVYSTVALPWSKTFRGGPEHRMKAHWTSFQSEQFYGYLDVIIPVRTANGTVGYLESILSSTSMMRQFKSTLMNSLRAYGRHFVVDPRDNVLIADSWNETVNRLPAGSARKHRFCPADVSDPLVLAAASELTRMGFLGPLEVTKHTEGKRDRAKFCYGRDTAWVYAYNYASSTATNLNMVFVIATLETDYFASVYHARTVMVCELALIALMVVCLAYAAAAYIVRALNRLIPALISTKDLLF